MFHIFGPLLSQTDMYTLLTIFLSLSSMIPFTIADVSFPNEYFVESFGIHSSMPIPTKFCQEASPYCHCKDSCTETGQCCTDYLWNRYIPENKLFDNFNEILSNHTKKLMAAVPITQTCRSFFQGNFQIQDNFIMKDSCLPTASVEESRKCTKPRPDLSLPVLGSDKNLYANLNCAKCNNISTFKFLEMEVHCKEKPEITTDLTSALLSSECTLKVDSNHTHYVKKCVSKERCTDEIATLCKMFLNGFNAFCSHCDKTDQGLGGGDGGTFHWSKTINLISFENIQNECLNGEIKNIFGDCIQPSELCGKGYEFTDSGCVLRSQLRSTVTPIKEVENSSLRNCITSTPLKLLVYVAKSVKVTKTALPIQEIQVKFNLSINNWIKINIDNETDLWETNSVFFKTEDFSTLKEINENSTMTKKMVLFSLRDTLNTSLYGYNHTRTFKNSKLCASVDKIPVNNVTFLNNSCQSLLLYNQSLVNMSSINLEVEIANGYFEESVYQCNKHHLHSSCLRQIIDPEAFVIDKNHSLYFNMTEKEYSFAIHEYIPIEKGFQICQSETKQSTFEKYEWYTDAMKAQYYISVIGTSFSLIAYLIMFLVFYLLKDLQNTGGIHVLILVILLFFADLVFIISSAAKIQTYFCEWVGTVLHFLLILVCQWTAVVAINLAVQFSRSSRAAHHSPRAVCNKMLYCLIANTLLFALIISLNETGVIQFEYQVSCWIGSIYPAIGFYFIPVIIVYITCIVSLSIVIQSIKKQQKDSEKVLSGNANRTKVNISKIAIKLFVILGVTEFIGLIQIPSSDPSESELIFNTTFAIIYDITRSFRGVLICIVYLLNEKTLKMMKTYYKGRSTDHSMTTISSRVTMDSTV